MACNSPFDQSRETLIKSHIVVPAPDQVEGRLQREPRLIKHFWIPACAGMTLNQTFPRGVRDERRNAANLARTALQRMG
jgi:hypothetical protein